LCGIRVVIPTEALSCCSAGCNKHTHDLEVYYLGFINRWQEAAIKVVPKVKGNFLKHWWSEELDQLKQECIEATNLWQHLVVGAQAI